MARNFHRNTKVENHLNHSEIMHKIAIAEITYGIKKLWKDTETFRQQNINLGESEINATGSEMSEYIKCVLGRPFELNEYLLNHLSIDEEIKQYAIKNVEGNILATSANEKDVPFSIIFQPKNTSDTIISISGTDIQNVRDMTSNLQSGFGGLSHEFQSTYDWVKSQSEKINPNGTNRITLMGHSNGGVLAKYICMANELVKEANKIHNPNLPAFNGKVIDNMDIVSISSPRAGRMVIDLAEHMKKNHLLPKRFSHERVTLFPITDIAHADDPIPQFDPESVFGASNRKWVGSGIDPEGSRRIVYGKNNQYELNKSNPFAALGNFVSNTNKIIQGNFENHKLSTLFSSVKQEAERTSPDECIKFDSLDKGKV